MDTNARILAVMLDALAEVGAPHAVFGGLVAGYYGDARRATADVDMLVSRRFLEPLQAGLERRGYEVRQFPHLLKMYPRGARESKGDLVVQESSDVLRAAFAGATPAEILGLPVSVVRRGALVALKFQAATTPRRRSGDRALDVNDIRGVLEKEFGPEDERLALEIAGMMYARAGADLRSLLDDLRHGRWPKVTRRAGMEAGMLLRRGLSPLRRRSLR
jgi:hypothetical protein